MPERNSIKLLGLSFLLITLISSVSALGMRIDNGGSTSGDGAFCKVTNIDFESNKIRGTDRVNCNKPIEFTVTVKNTGSEFGTCSVDVDFDHKNSDWSRSWDVSTGIDAGHKSTFRGMTTDIPKWGGDRYTLTAVTDDHEKTTTFWFGKRDSKLESVSFEDGKLKIDYSSPRELEGRLQIDFSKKISFQGNSGHTLTGPSITLPSGDHTISTPDFDLVGSHTIDVLLLGNEGNVVSKLQSKEIQGREERELVKTRLNSISYRNGKMRISYWSSKELEGRLQIDFSKKISFQGNSGHTLTGPSITLPSGDHTISTPDIDLYGSRNVDVKLLNRNGKVVAEIKDQKFNGKEEEEERGKCYDANLACTSNCDEWCKENKGPNWECDPEADCYKGEPVKFWVTESRTDRTAESEPAGCFERPNALESLKLCACKRS